MYKFINGLLLAVAVVVAAWVLTDNLARRGRTLPAVPNPNGYESLVKIAARLEVSKDMLDAANPAALKKMAAANREALDEAHQALRTDAAVPLKVTENWVDEHEAEVKGLKRMAAAFAIQAGAQSQEGHTNLAAQSALDTILLGHVMRRGGIRSDALNGLAVEIIGHAVMMRLVPSLDADTARAIAQELEKSDERQEGAEVILENERNWSAASFGAVHVAGGLLLRKANAKRADDLTKRLNEASGRLRSLMLLLAAKAVEQETGTQVTQPAQVVPAVLAKIPLDPKTGKPFQSIPGTSQSDSEI